ncbi:AT-rich interactive domain-containing protein 4B isoform X2 [Uranotaenia lowii]|uniref:AT-rich interactive domain-containing protein 4B isoform X2 n=1 Tax=Uranotaenia lowii TaxID=190385 RepID=UPI00247A892C|nr:AT-rich interactive domain-containing protein 4B isoform X2 [Uranotaenia lowii]
MQQVDDPPYLTVGTEVSAKYKGAFCEAKVRKVVRNIKCRVAYKQPGFGSAIVSDDQIKGALRVGATVEVKHPEKKEYVEATLTKIQDCSQYTVVFDDGDITTLRRSALCLKSGRHFNESETLDQLPLTHPEHFSNPVIGGRRGRRSRHLLPDDSSDDDEEPASTSRSNVDDKEEHIGKVVVVESTDNKKKNPKENWFPGLVVAPTAQDQVRIRVKDEYLVRSFKDGRYYTVPKKEASDFTRDCTNKSEAAAVSAALDYLDNDTMPPHWDREALFGTTGSCSDSEQELETDSSDDEPTEEKDHFVAQLYKFMDDRGTPLNKVPSIINRDVNLYRLFRAVQKLNGYNRVTSQNQWKQIALRLGFSPATASITNLVKQAYKKFLFSFEEFNRKLGCTMVPHPRANRSKGRSLVRAGSVQSPKTTEKEKPSASKSTPVSTVVTASTAATAASEAASSSAVDESGNTSESSTAEVKPTNNKRKLSGASNSGGKVKALVDKFEEKEREKEKEKEKEREKEREKEKEKEKEKAKESKKEESVKKEKNSPKPVVSTPKIPESDKRGSRKRKETDSTDSKKDDKDSGKASSSGASSTSSSTESVKGGGNNPSISVEAKVASGSQDFPIEVGDKLKVYYDEQKVTYEAKVIEIANQEGSPIYLVHYTGWNTRYDEWVRKERVAENLTNSKTKKGKSDKSSGNKITNPPQGDKPSNAPGTPSNPNPTTASSSTASTPQTPKASKRIRGNSKGDNTTTPTTGSSIAGPNTNSPRSTTPSSANRTKSPGSAFAPGPHRRSIKRGGGHTSSSSHPTSSSKRRTSNNTDISSLSIATDDNNSSDSDSDEPIKKCSANNTNSNSSSSTASSNSSSSSSSSSSSVSSSSTKVSTTAEAGSSSDAAAISDEFSNGASKGRDYDLNQIRSELKGFKELKSPTSPASDSTTTATTDVAPTGQSGASAAAGEAKKSADSKPPSNIQSVLNAQDDTSLLKDETDDFADEEHEKSSESGTLSEEDSSQSSNKAFSSSPITAMVDSDTGPDTPIPPPTVSTPTPIAVTTTTSSVISTISTFGTVKHHKSVETSASKIIEKVVEKPLERGVKIIMEEKVSTSTPSRPPLKTYGTAAAILANAENNAVKFAFSTIIRETEGDKAAPAGGGETAAAAGAAGPSGVQTPPAKETSAPIISKPSHLLPDERVERNTVSAQPPPVPHRTITAAPANPMTLTVSTPTSVIATQNPAPTTKNAKLINVQDEIVATVIHKSAIVTATSATAVSAAVSSSIPANVAATIAPTQTTPTPPLVSTSQSSGSSSISTLAALRAEKKLSGDKKLDKVVIPSSKLQPLAVPTVDKKLSSTTLTPAQNKLLNKEALSIKSIFESSTRMDEKISDVYEFQDVDFDTDTSVAGGGPSRRLVSDVPQAEVVASLNPTIVTPEDKKSAKKGIIRKPTVLDPLGLSDKKAKKISPIKETDKLKLVRREKERDPEKEKLLLSELEGAAASFSSTMVTPEKSSPHFAGFSSASKLDVSFEILRKSPLSVISSIKDEKPIEDMKPEPAKLAAVTKGIFTPVMSPTGLDISGNEIMKSPSKHEEKIKEEPTLENCKKYFNDMNFEFDAPKIEKPPSIADKVLKALQQQQSSTSTVKTELPKYIIPTPHHKTPSLVPIESVISSTPIAAAPLKLEASNFAPVIPIKTIHAEPPKIEMPLLIKKELENTKPLVIPIKPLTSFSVTAQPEILPPTTSTKNQNLTESIKKLETSNLVQAESRFTHHDEDSTDSNDSEHRLVIEDPEALDISTGHPNQQTDFEKLIKVEVEDKTHLSQMDIQKAASAAAVAAVASKEKLVYKPEISNEPKDEPQPSLFAHIVHSSSADQKKSKQPSILETIIQSELTAANSRGIGSHSYLKLKDQQDSFAQNELERLRREEQQNHPPIQPPSNPAQERGPETPEKQTQQQQQPSNSSESLSLLLCEETIPGSPAPVCGVSSAAAQKETTKVYVETGSSFLQPQNIAASDLKQIPMELEPNIETIAMTGNHPGRKPSDAADTPSSSPRDSVSQDENQEPESSPTKKRRPRKTSEEPINKRRRTAGSLGNNGSRGSLRGIGSNATDSEDNSDSAALHRGGGGHSSAASGSASPASGRSGRPCQYNFLVNLDPALNSAQRVAILKKKIQELRKTYNAIKAELASIDRRRKKLRRRERENKKQAKMASGTTVN